MLQSAAQTMWRGVCVKFRQRTSTDIRDAQLFKCFICEPTFVLRENGLVLSAGYHILQSKQLCTVLLYMSLDLALVTR